MIKKSGWKLLSVAFFLLLNFTVSWTKVLFLSRLIYFLFILSLFFILRPFKLDKVLRFSVGWVSTIIFLFGIFQKYVLFPINLSKLSAAGEDFYSQAVYIRLKTGRIYSIFALPTLYAFICTVLILFIFHYLVSALKDKKKSRGIIIFWATAMLLGLFNLVLTQSFGGIIYLGAGIMVYLLSTGILKSRYLLPALSLLSLILFITAALRFSEVKKLEPVKLRFSNWMQASRIISANPFWGVGLGNYESSISAYTQAYEARSIYSHNFFLQFTAETGLVVPIILILFLYVSRKRLKRINQQDKALYLSVLAVLFFYNLIDIGLYFFSAGIIFAIVLSQLYPAKDAGHYLNRPKAFMALTFIFFSGLLLVEAISDGSRKNADFYNSYKQYESAEAHYKRSLAFNPFNYKAMVGMADLLHKRSRADEAVPYLQKALVLNADYPYANFLQSRILYKQKRYLKAFYYAQAAHQRNRLNNVYKTWADSLRKNLDNALKQGRGAPPTGKDGDNTSAGVN